MNLFPWILLILLVLSVIVGVITVFVVKRKRRQGKTDDPDYRALFVLGICFLPMGLVLSITTENPGFYGIAAMGLVFLIVGIAHKDEWKE